MRVLAWNICQGGENHPAQAGAVSAHDPDVIVLSEHQTTKSHPLIQQLRQSGWTHIVASPTEGRRNGVAILAKERTIDAASPFGDPPFAWWGVETRVGDLTVIGVYAPLKTSWAQTLAASLPAGAEPLPA